MNAARDELLRRRERLQFRSGELRHEWARQVQVLRAPLGLADRARDGVHWLVRHPEWPLGAALLILLLRPGRTLRWASYGLQGYALYRRAQRVMARPLTPAR